MPNLSLTLLEIQQRLHWRLLARPFVLIALASLAACGGADFNSASSATNDFSEPIESLQPAQLAAGESLRVVATTTLVSDIVGRVGGEHIQLTTLLPFGADPHGYSASAQDLKRVAQAHLVVSAGFGLEASLLAEVKEAAPDVPIVSASEGVEPLAFGAAEAARSDHANHEAEAGGGRAPEAGGVDPHVWFDPIRAQQWVENTARALSLLDSANEASYQGNRDWLLEDLVELDRWIRQQVQVIPSAQRLLVTDHLALTYFAERYQFELVGALIPAYSSSAETSAQDLAKLQTLAEERQVRALFVGSTANPALAEQVSADLGIPVVRLYTGSLTAPGGEADDYFEFMRYNVRAIVDALAE